MKVCTVGNGKFFIRDHSYRVTVVLLLQTDEHCCNSCEEVREAYSKKGWAISNPDGIDQVHIIGKAIVVFDVGLNHRNKVNLCVIVVALFYHSYTSLH